MIMAKSCTPTQKKVKINCVDFNSEELVYSWLLIVEADKPDVTKTHKVYCKTGVSSVQAIPIHN